MLNFFHISSGMSIVVLTILGFVFFSDFMLLRAARRSLS
jgi:hypothetical protein